MRANAHAHPHATTRPSTALQGLLQAAQAKADAAEV
jgi:hypothetical protein